MGLNNQYVFALENLIDKTVKQTKQLVSADLAGIVTAWYKWLKVERNLSRHTQYNYLQDLKSFFLFYQEYTAKSVDTHSLVNITLSAFRSFLVYRRKNGVSARSNARSISTLKNFFRFLEKRYNLVNNELQTLSPQKLDQLLPRPVDVAKALSFVEVNISDDDFVNTRSQALFALLYGAGLRISEALNLNIGDVGYNDYLKVIGKGNKERIVPLLPIVNEKINAYLTYHPEGFNPHTPLFVGVKGKRLNAGVAQKTVRDLRLQLGLPDSTTPHSLRHSFATHLLAENVDLRYLQELLGHSSLASTQRYTGVDIQRLQAVHAHNHPRSNRLKD